jgi:DNA-binding transcriptional LysR family regulator
MVSGCTLTPLFDALAAFHLAHPGVEIELVEDNSDRLIERVRGGMVDLALVGCSSALPHGLDAMPIVSEHLVAACLPSHPLASRSRLTLSDVCEFPIVTMPEGTGIRSVFDQACLARGLRPHIAMQASAPGAVADLAARGLGVGVLVASMLAAYEGQLRGLVVDDVDAPAVLALTWTTTVSPALRELLAHSRAAFGRAVGALVPIVHGAEKQAGASTAIPR